MRQQYERFMPVGEFAPLLGPEPQVNFGIMVWGLPGQGKTTLLIKFCRWFARHYGKVCYVANEEFGRGTLQDKLSTCGGSVPGLDFYKFTPTDAELRQEGYKLIVFDSQRTLKLTLDQFKDFTQRHPKLARIVVMQATKGGQFKGENDWPHEVDIELEAFGPGQARTTKNRFGPLRTIKIF